MGAWGTGPFDNDAAQDWLGGLEDEIQVRIALEKVCLTIDTIPEPDGSNAVAAAALVASSVSADYFGRLDRGARRWAARHKIVVTDEFRARAVEALECVRERSYLHKLWI